MRKARVQPFDLAAALPAAWKLLWDGNMKEKAKNEAGRAAGKPPGYREDNCYFLTASDLENQVRAFAIEQSEGKKWGTGGRAWGKPMAWPPVRIHIRSSRDLLGACRDWLLDQVRFGKLTSHNFGRGHISGMRFRPKGAPLSEAEKKTTKRNEDRRSGLVRKPFHFSAWTPENPTASHRAVCIPKPKGWSRGRSSAMTTRDKAKVTCPRCIKIMNAPVCTEAKSKEPA